MTELGERYDIIVIGARCAGATFATLASRAGARVLCADQAALPSDLVLSTHDESQPSGDDKTSLLFSVRDEVGILSRMLRPFATHNIDLIKIESRPLRGRPWEYVFYLDLKGHRRERRIERALGDVGRSALRLKILGSYPAAPPPAT